MNDYMNHNVMTQLMSQREVLKSFSRVLTAGYDVDRLLDLFLSTIQEMLHVGRIAIVLKEDGIYKIKASRGISAEAATSVTFDKTEGLMCYIAREGTALRLTPDRFIDERILSQMRSLGVTTAVPLWKHGFLLGAIIFNNKTIGTPINDQELELVFTLGNQLSIAIENANLVKEVSRQKDYFEDILNHVNSGVITVDPQGLVATYNPKAQEILGIDRSLIHGKDLLVLPKEIAELLKESLGSEMSCSRKEIKLAPSDRLIGVSVTPIRSEDKKVTGAVMIFTDLAPVKRLQQEDRRNEQLAFVNTVAMRSSHELKNCLVSIKTFAQLLPERYMDKQFREDFYLVVNKEVDRLNQLVENLLFFAQPLQLNCSACDIDEIIHESIDMLYTKDILVNIDIQKEFDHRSGYVELDKDGFLRVLKNILYNSIQSMPKGGKIRVLTCDMSDENQDSIELRVIDEGVGVSEESISKIWDPFYTTKARGIGLGLTISRKIIEAHGGRIQITSTVDKGTEVTVLIPRMFQQSGNERMYFPSGRAITV